MSASIWQILIVAVVVLLLFGRGKISGMMGEVANGIKAFQKGMKDDDKSGVQIDAKTVEPEKTEQKKDA